MRKDRIRKSKRAAALIPMTILIMFVSTVVAAEDMTLCPVGKTVGIVAYTDGVCVVNTTEFETETGEIVSPAADAGICCGDTILEINDKKVSSAKEFEKAIDNSKGNNLKIKLQRNNEEYEVNLKAKKRENDGKLRIGVWIKNSASGIGTLTYYDKKTGKFGALGHGICDENNFLTEMTDGSVHKAEITSLRKGEVGAPGELIAVFDDRQNVIGNMSANTNCGIFGILNKDFINAIGQTEEMPIASRNEVKEGSATILSNIDGYDVCEYSAEITKINKDEKSSKGMIIKITDEGLIDKTGGIVRGMSGSPILQNGKLVGAVTHVLVNDPKRGYGIFIENMLAEAEKISD